MTECIKRQIAWYLKTIRETALACQRSPESIHLLLVTKNQSETHLKTAFEAGIHNFGESYWQEARQKMQALKNLPITWHFIGPMQTNKAKHIATHFHWVHSVSRLEIIEILGTQRPVTLPALNVCIQVNLDGDPNKSGCEPNVIEPLAETILKYPQLKLRGLMTIPQINHHPHHAFEVFSQLKHTLTQLSKTCQLPLDTLSMGMTSDFIPAIQAGSTWLRIGRGIFNPTELYSH